MSTEEVGVVGYQPALAVQPGNPEAQKYGRLWAMDEYRKVAPGEGLAQVFLRVARPRAGANVADFGCGTGRGALMMALLGNVKVIMVDFVRNCLDPEIQQALTTQAHALSFVKADLEMGPLPITEYGFCTDVMEHIPPDKVDRVLDNILRASQHVFFSVSTVEDSCGKLIDEPLHLSIHPFAWWLEQFTKRQCLVHWSKDAGTAALFYVSAWATGKDICATGVLNIEDQTVLDNIRHNVGQGWTQIAPHWPNGDEVMILGGGPSMLAFEDEIRRKRAQGIKLITLNGAYGWALGRGLGPVTEIIVDARPFNARFVEPVRDDCLYLIASQCDPSVFAKLPPKRTLMWHSLCSSTGSTWDTLKDLYGDKVFYGIPGGPTVLLGAIPLLSFLGFKRFHLYGCDSCLTDDAVHHAYAQPENDGALVVPVVVNASGELGRMEDGQASGRVFYCHPWMIAQAENMLNLLKVYGEEIELEIHGDGLLAHILKVMAAAVDANPALQELPA